jgi:hypothetical protein
MPPGDQGRQGTDAARGHPGRLSELFPPNQRGVSPEAMCNHPSGDPTYSTGIQLLFPNTVLPFTVTEIANVSAGPERASAGT